MSDTPGADAIAAFFQELPNADSGEILLALAERIEADPAAVVATLRQAAGEATGEEKP